MGLKKTYEELTDDPEFTSGITITDGQGIRGNSGNKQLRIEDNGTIIQTPGGQFSFAAQDSLGVYIQPNATSEMNPRFIRDARGQFDAVKYISDGSAPSTLELTNANQYIQPLTNQGRLGVANSVRDDNDNGVTYFSTALESSEIIGPRLRLGLDNFGAGFGSNSTSSLEIASYGAGLNKGGGEINFINTRFGTRTGAIISKRDGFNSGYIGLYTFVGGNDIRRLFISGEEEYVEVENSQLRATDGKNGTGEYDPNEHNPVAIEIGGLDNNDSYALGFRTTNGGGGDDYATINLNEHELDATDGFGNVSRLT
jgi:hypothetical protein